MGRALTAVVVHSILSYSVATIYGSDADESDYYAADVGKRVHGEIGVKANRQFSRFDSNVDGKLSYLEVLKLLSDMDKNGDEHIEMTEWDAFLTEQCSLQSRRSAEVLVEQERQTGENDYGSAEHDNQVVTSNDTDEWFVGSVEDAASSIKNSVVGAMQTAGSFLSKGLGSIETFIESMLAKVKSFLEEAFGEGSIMYMLETQIELATRSVVHLMNTVARKGLSSVYKTVAAPLLFWMGPAATSFLEAFDSGASPKIQMALHDFLTPLVMAEMTKLVTTAFLAVSKGFMRVASNNIAGMVKKAIGAIYGGLSNHTTATASKISSLIDEGDWEDESRFCSAVQNNATIDLETARALHRHVGSMINESGTAHVSHVLLQVR